MLVSRKGDLPVLWSSPVNHADVFMRVGDAMDVEESRRDQGARARLCRRRAFADQFHVEAALFLRLAQRGNLRVLVQFNVAAERQPFVEPAMMNEQHLAVVNDEYRHCKINFFVDVGHCGKDCGKRAGVRQTLHCVGSIPGKGICRRPAMTCLWRIES